MDFVEEIRKELDKVQEEEVLGIIVMILEFYLSKYDRNLDKTINLIKKGYKKYLEFLKEGE